MQQNSWLCIGTLHFITVALLAINAVAQEPASTPSPTASPPRSVRISFVPPPIEGTISLGIFDENEQLVRVLHQEAGFDDFTAGPDALVTKWDGKDDFGNDLWPGTYHARGYLVAPMKVEELGTETTDTLSEMPSIKVRLIANPLNKKERPTIELVAGIDDGEVILRTADGLPLLTIAQQPEAQSATLALDRENRNAIVFVHTPAAIDRFSVSGVNRLMAFDCGRFELR